MLLFHAKTIMRESCNFELACLKKKKERKTFLVVWQLSGLERLHRRFTSLRVFLVMKTHMLYLRYDFQYEFVMMRKSALCTL